MGRPANCNCNCLSPLWSIYDRPLTCLGPLTSDTSVSGYTTSWIYSNIVATNSRYSYQTDSNPFNWFWGYFSASSSTVLMRPIRFALFTYPELSGFREYPPVRRQSSNLSAPATSTGHFSGSEMVSAITTAGLFSSPNASATESQITHWRISVDGSDVSGVVEFPTKPLFNFNAASLGFGRLWSNTSTLPLSSTINISSAKSIYIDLWVRFKPQNASGFALPVQVFVPSGGFTYVLAAHGSRGQPNGSIQPIVTPGRINVHRRLRPTDRYSITFTGRTWGGLSTLVTESQTGWSFTRQGAMITMQKTTGTGAGERITFNYSTETPEIVLQNPTLASLYGTQRGMQRYHTESPSYYEPEYTGTQLGPIDTTGSNTFVSTGTGPLTGFATRIWDTTPSGISAPITSGYFPSSMTLTKV